MAAPKQAASSEGVRDLTRETLLETFKTWIDLRQFFRQRRIILNDPAVILAKEKPKKWLNATQFALQGSVAISLIVGAAQWALKTGFKIEELPRDEITNQENYKTFIKDEFYKAAAAGSLSKEEAESYQQRIKKLEDEIKFETDFLDTREKLTDLAVPLTVLLSGLVFSFVIKWRAEPGAASPLEAYFYVGVASLFWLAFTLTALDLFDSLFVFFDFSRPSAMLAIAPFWMWPICAGAGRRLRAIGYPTMYLAQTYSAIGMVNFVVYGLWYWFIILLSLLYAYVRL